MAINFMRSGEERNIISRNQRDCQRTGYIDIGTDTQSSLQKGERGHAGSDAHAGKDCPSRIFPHAKLVSDRFHTSSSWPGCCQEASH
ncbi:MAG: hypothetical protein ACTIJ8_15180 [Sphingobacterium sp.]